MNQDRHEPHVGHDPKEYLTFRLGDEEYGMDILRVQEIRGYEPATRIADTPPFIKGVINLRGVIVPIVDLRIKLNIGPAEYTPFTVVIIINIMGKIIGIVVDAVSDVVSLDADHISPPPELGSTLDTRYITGLGTLEGQMLILVDMERLMGSEEMQLLEQAA